MNDDPVAGPSTLLERMIAMSIGEDRAQVHLRGRFVRVGGEPVTDPDFRTTAPFVICPPAITEHQAATA
ncbi:hypothetical protein [Pseudonocardia ailaonensis]|uniref:hypothetical protein n=1 Tax=Pseudonocardia ailaonensis TaxID=367279 RepID=UPI0031E45E46